MTDIVGRGQEIAAVSRWFRADGPTMLVIDGPAGLGKTTVWSESVAAIRASGARVLVSSPTEAEAGLPYS